MQTDGLITIAIAVFASTGFWNFLNEFIKTKSKKKSVADRVLLGMAHDRIHFLCKSYIRQGYMSEEDYDTLKSIADPYLEMGGNGSGKKLWEQAQKLPIKNVQE